MNIKNMLFRATHWETWNYLAKYIPIMPVWLWYCVKGRSFWFFTPSNPTLTFGGFEGEEKKEMYDQLPAGSFPKTIYIDPSLSFNQVEAKIIINNFKFPFAVKPNVGMMGYMFRKIHSANDLLLYHQKMPVQYVLQELIEYPIEVSVFYYRYPNQTTGTITGFLKKEFLEVIGDGHSTLLKLMEEYPRVRFRLDEMKSKHADKLDLAIPKGEIYFLSYALNLSRGGKLVSLAEEIDERLVRVIDEISNYTKHFYYGRYDIKCASIEDFKAGKNFSILEYNGCGAEPHHIYGNENTLIQAYKIVLQHWKILYKISSYNNSNGYPKWKFKKGFYFLKQAKVHFKILKEIDANFVL